MRQTIPIRDGYTQDEIDGLMAQLNEMIEIQEGDLYTFHRGALHHIPPKDDEQWRKVPIMDKAYKDAQAISRGLRAELNGYRPDPVLVISALVEEGCKNPQVKKIVIDFIQSLVTPPQQSSVDPTIKKRKRKRRSGPSDSTTKVGETQDNS